jgi:hypothetical protein
VNEGGRFSGVIGLTVRLYRANLGPLLVVAMIAGALVLATTLLFRHLSPGVAITGAHLGVIVRSGTGGSGIRLVLPSLAVGLIEVFVLAWASATMTAMLVGHVREGRSATLGDLKAGNPYWATVGAAALLIRLVPTGLNTLSALPPPGASAPLRVIATILDVAFSVAVIFYVQQIVDAGRNGGAALLESWSVVRRVGFWNVLAVVVLGEICVVPVMVVTMLLGMLLPIGIRSAAIGFAITVILGPLVAAFATVMYFLATGARERLAVMACHQ